MNISGMSTLDRLRYMIVVWIMWALDCWASIGHACDLFVFRVVLSLNVDVFWVWAGWLANGRI